MSSILCYYLRMDTKINQNSAIFKALECVLKPLVRLMLARGITYIQLTEWLKHIFVETAVREFSLPEKAINDSRISVITGVHRKDVKRLREIMHTNPILIEPTNVNLGSKIVSAWLSNSLYMHDGMPKSIARLKKDGGNVSFEALAEIVTKDVRARAALDELERVGAVNVDENDMVSLITDAFIPAKGEDEKAFYMGLGVGDHAATAVHNVLNCQPPSFDRVVHYKGLSLESVQAIEQLSRAKGSQLLQEINKKAEKLPSIADTPNVKSKRFTLGVYFYSEDEI
jgi:Family of unknown function (DUF6502)